MREGHTEAVDAGLFLIQIDTPSIKKYVFGADALNEVRGASAWLDWLTDPMDDL